MRTIKWIKNSAWAILMLLFLSLVGCRDSGPVDTVRPVAVRVTRPVTADLQERLSYLGTYNSSREIRVIAQVQGTVRELPFAEGSRIANGDVLIRLDAPDLRAAVERLRVERDYWERHSAADQRLVQQNALPEEQAALSLRAFQSAHAAFEEAGAKLDKTLERSPINGHVLKEFVESGQHVMPGQLLLLIGTDQPEIRVDVVEEDLERGIQVHTRAELTDGSGSRHQAAVSEIAMQADGPARTFTVKIRPKNASELSGRSGSSVVVDFILREALGVLAVPTTALAGQNSIFLIRDNRAWSQSVQTGIEQDGRVQVSFAWNGQDAVAVSNLASLRDSTWVYPVPIQEVER